VYCVQASRAEYERRMRTTTLQVPMDLRFSRGPKNSTTRFFCTAHADRVNSLLEPCYAVCKSVMR
ncbi:MAG: hypothetical protein ACK56I_31375, partial [bacterium]